MGFLKKLLKERKKGTAAVTRASPVDSASRSQKGATVERIQNEAGSLKSPILVTSEVRDPSTSPKVPDELASGSDRKFSTAHIEQQKENLHSRVDSDLTGSSSAEPRLAKSLQRLNESVTEFEEIYAKHADKEVEKKGWDNALSKVLNDVQLTDDMFDNAIALENRINQTLTRREELKEDRSRRKSMSRYIANVFPLLKFLVDIGGMAAQTAGCLPASTVLRASAVVVGALTTAANCPEDMASNLKSISYQARRLTSLQGSNRTEHITEKSMDLLTAIVKYYSACLVVFNHGLIVNAAKEIYKGPNSAYKGAAADLQIAISEFDQALQDQTRALIVEISKFGSEKNDHAMFEWLSPSHWEVVGQLSGHIYRHLGGTLTWLHSLPELNAWLTGKGPQIFWMTGLPGIGKSIIAANLVSTLHPAALGDQCEEVSSITTVPKISPRRSQPFLAYFFCKSGEDKLMHAHNIVQTFSYQLARQSDIFDREVNKSRVIEQFTVSPSVGIRLLYNRLVERPLSALGRSFGQENVFCIIDGLDEADFSVRDGRSGSPEIAILLHLLAASPQIRLLVLSRRIKELCETLDVLPSVSREISGADNGDDIELYVEWKVSHCIKLRQGFSELNVSPVDHFLNELRCNFLWTDIVLRFLEGSASKNDFALGLQEIPVQFFELYRQILGRIASTASPRKRGFIKVVIRTIISSPRRFDIVELQSFVEEALADRFFDFLYLLKSECGTFVRIVEDANDEKRKYVQVAHETFYNFITSEASANNEFHVSLPESHGEIALILLRYLSNHDFGSQLTDGTFTGREDGHAAEVREKFPLLQYAATMWSVHVRHSWGSSEQISTALKEFLTQGPLLLWIEALATFSQLPALSRSMEDVLVWTTIRATIGKIDSELFEIWARDISRLCTESSKAITEYPNCIHRMLFDLFPSPSLFYDRYKTGVASVSGNASTPLNPILAGVSNFYYNTGYNSSAFSSGPTKLFALANTEHIRILQAFGGSVFIISAPAPGLRFLGPTQSQETSPVRSLNISFPLLPQENKWAVLAMAFGPSKLGLKVMLAAVHVPLLEEDSPYSPILSIWDLDELVMIASVPLNLEGVDDCFCLIDWVGFSEDGLSVHCGVWKYDIVRDKTTVEAEDLRELAGAAEAITLSPDCQRILRLDRSDSRVLVSTNFADNVTFNKPQVYTVPNDEGANLLPSELEYRRHETSPLYWWQSWWEVTRSYKFSADSRWFARFTARNSVVLYDLKEQTEIEVTQPDDSWSNILINNLAFDTESKRLAWTFNYMDLNKAQDTRIELWSTEKLSSIGGFSLGRYGWRDRIAFCADHNHVMTFRSGIAMWDVNRKTNFNREVIEGETSVISGFGITEYCIRVGYCASDVYLLYPDKRSGKHILQAFRRRTGTRKLLFHSAAIGSNHWWFPWTSDGKLIAVADTTVDISSDNMSRKSLAVPTSTVTTAFHLPGSLLACLQQTESTTLRLICTTKSEELATSQFRKVSKALIVFDPAPVPKFLLVVTDDLDVVPLIRVSVFHVPSLKLEKIFSVNAPIMRLDPDMNGDISDQKLVFYGQQKNQNCCVLFIIDLENEQGRAQVFPDFRHLVYIKSKKRMVGITTRGWVQSKTQEEMELEALNQGETVFDGRTDASWVLENWKKLLYVPPSFLPSYESGFAVHAKGEVAYVSDLGKRLVQISFKW